MKYLVSYDVVKQGWYVLVRRLAAAVSRLVAVSKPLRSSTTIFSQSYASQSVHTKLLQVDSNWTTSPGAVCSVLMELSLATKYSYWSLLAI